MNQRERKTYSAEFIRINRKYEAKYFPLVRKAIKAKISSLIAALNEGGYAAGIQLLSTSIGNAEISKVVKRLYLEVGLRHARKTYRHLRAMEQQERKSRYGRMEQKGFGYNAEWVAFILNYLEATLLEQITFEVDRTTRDRLLKVLQDGVAEGLSIDLMVKKLEDLPLTRVQAARIVRTETNRAANVGTIAAVDTSEYLMQKEWISARDVRTRGVNPKDHADHIYLNGKVVDFEEKFKDSRSGSLLSFPGDPEGKAEDVINCRCCVAPRAKRDENGRLMKKPAVYAPVLGMLRPPIAASPNIGLRVTN